MTTVYLTLLSGQKYDSPSFRREGSSPMTPRTARTALVVLVLVAVFGAGTGLAFWWPRARSAPPVAPSALGTADALQTAFVGVAQRVRPAVVNIGTIQVARTRRAPFSPGQSDDPFFKDFFDQFFGNQAP